MFPKKSVANTKNNTTQQQSQSQSQSQSQPPAQPRPTGLKRCSLCALRKK